MVRFTERDEHGDLYVKEHDYISAFGTYICEECGWEWSSKYE